MAASSLLMPLPPPPPPTPPCFFSGSRGLATCRRFGDSFKTVMMPLSR